MKRLSLCGLLPVLALGGIVACSDDDDNDRVTPSLNPSPRPEVDCQADVPTFGEVTAFQTVCTQCHSSTLTGEARNGAPGDHNWDVYASAFREAEDIVEEVAEGDMPPPSSGLTLTTEERQQIYTWALCGRPE